MSQVFSFIKENQNLKHEFTYVNADGLSIEGHNHTAQIASALTMDATSKQRILASCIWLDKDCFETELNHVNFDYLVLSMVTDASLGLYRHKATRQFVAFYPKKYDVTSKTGFQKFELDILKPSRLQFGNQDFESFSQEFEYVQNEDFNITIESLSTILDILSKKGTKLILLLGSERKYPGPTSFTYQDREKEHQRLNTRILEWAAQKDHVILLPFDRYITDDNCFLDTINHFKKYVYFEMAKDLAKVIGDSDTVEIRSKGTLYRAILKEKAKKIKQILRPGKNH